MGFKIHFKGSTYTASEFVQLATQGEFAAAVAGFVSKWTNNEPFTFYTSGSTGKPKPVVFNKGQLQASARLTIQALQLLPQQTHILLCLHPKFVGGAMMIARALELDCDITLLEPGNQVIDQLHHHHPFTFASFVPSQLNPEQLDLQKFNRFKQVLIGGATIAAALENLLRTASPTCYHTYGMTETLSHIALRRIGFEEYFTPLPHILVKTNSKACICIQTPFTQHWLETNDLVELHAGGSFKFLGRTDFVINSGASKIHPEQVEEAIGKLNEIHHFIRGSFIISSVNDLQWGQKCVCVVNEKMSAEHFKQLKELLAGKIPKYQIPKAIMYVEDWKLTGNGKIDRKAIKELIDNQIV